MRAAVRATQKAADEPRPDPYGSSVVMMTVAGLNLKKAQQQDSRNLKTRFEKISSSSNCF